VAKSETSESPNPVVSLAKQGISIHSLTSFKLSIDCWIIDIGASNHMNGSLQVLSAYKPCDQGLSISMVDGTIAMAQGKGTVNVGGLKLQLVLFVPNLSSTCCQ